MVCYEEYYTDIKVYNIKKTDESLSFKKAHHIYFNALYLITR
jgi:hypothetical protein